MSHGYGLGNGRLGGRGGAFTPKSLPGLVAWYRADMGVTQSGTVSAWADQSGNGFTATQAVGANQPTFTASDATFGGKPSLTSTATQWLTNASMQTTGPGTAFFVGKGPAGTVVYWSSGGATQFAAGLAGTSQTEASAGTILVANAPSIASSAMVTVLNGASGALYVNAKTPTTGTTGSSAGTPGVWLLNSSNQNQGGVTLAEFAYFNRALTASEASQLLTYAGNRYGIAVGA